MAPSISSRAFAVLLCVFVGRSVSVKTSVQSVAASELLYEAMGMAPSELSHTQTHISKCRQISHAFLLPFRFASPPPSLPPFFLLVSLVEGKVLIGLFPKLFLIKDKQGIHISLGDLGLPEVSCSLLVFFRLEGGAEWERWSKRCEHEGCVAWGGGGGVWVRRVFREKHKCHQRVGDVGSPASVSVSCSTSYYYP